MKLVSVIISCYNGERFLASAIDSLLDQTYSEVEIIVVDDGSQDQSGKVCARYPTVRYVYQENRGRPAAIEHGLTVSRGEYLVFMDYDDRLLSDAIEIGVNALDTHPECGFVFGSYRLIDSHGAPLAKQPNRNLKKTADYATLLACEHLIPPTGGMYRRSAIAAVGSFDSAMFPADDYELQLRVAQVYPVHFHQQTVFEYRRHDSNTSSNTIRMVKSGLHVVNAQWKYVQQSGNKDYKTAYRTAKRFWRQMLGRTLPGKAISQLKAGKFAAAKESFFATLRYYPWGFVEYAIQYFRRA